MMGDAFRGWVRKAMPEKSTELSNTLRWFGTRAPPNVGLKKYFCAMVKVKISRAAPALSSQMVLSAAIFFDASAGGVPEGRYLGFR